MATDTKVQRYIGNYELLLKIAEGGMGAVYKGRNRATGEVVAIKIIPAETARNNLLLRRFEQEFKAASLIDHPHVVKAIDYCGQGATPFLVMEFVDGRSLGARIDQEGPIPEAEAIRIISQVCEGLHRAHKQGLIHRDVKPDNILLTQENLAKLTDLGLVKDVEGEMNLTKTGRGLGTPHFMAPEQFRNAKNADVRCDVYSLGATLYTMVTGEIPFDKTTPLDCWLRKSKNDFEKPRRRNPQISTRLDWAICRAMHYDPSQRPANCREFMEDLLGTYWRTERQGSSGHLPLISPTKPTDPLTITEPPPPPIEDLWYMVYKDAESKPCTVKGSTKSIRKNLVAGVLGDLAAIVVCRTKTGQFLPLSSTPEFRDLAYQAGAIPKVKATLPSGSNKGSPGLTDTPKQGKTPTPPLRQPKPLSPEPLAFAVADVPTEQHSIEPVVLKSKIVKSKQFPPISDSTSSRRLPRTPDTDEQTGNLAWVPYATLGAIVLLLVLVTVFVYLK